MQATDKQKLTAALIRSFFRSFTAGILDTLPMDKKEKQDPKSLKHAMLNHYEQIAPQFLDAMFYPLAVMNFEYDEVAGIVAKAQEKHLSMMDLLRKVCATESAYNFVVDEYKQNFSYLLNGRHPALDVFFSAQASPNDQNKEYVETDKAIRLCVRMVMKGYAAGLKQDEEKAGMFRNATLFALMLDAMNALLCDVPARFSDEDDLSTMFMKVCQSQHNFDVMTAEMDSSYEELSQE